MAESPWRRNPAKWSARSWPITRPSVVVAGLMTLVAAVGCGVAATVRYSDAVALRDHGVVTMASITDIRPGHNSYLRVAFTTSDGRRVETDLRDFRADPEPVVGAAMWVRYVEGDPEVVQDIRLSPDFGIAWALGIASLAVLVFGGFVVRNSWLTIDAAPADVGERRDRRSVDSRGTRVRRRSRRTRRSRRRRR